MCELQRCCVTIAGIQGQSGLGQMYGFLYSGRPLTPSYEDAQRGEGVEILLVVSWCCTDAPNMTSDIIEILT